MHTMSVRASSYRGKPGWVLVGSPAGRSVRLSVFFECESAARRTFDKLVANPRYEIGSADFQPAEVVL